MERKHIKTPSQLKFQYPELSKLKYKPGPVEDLDMEVFRQFAENSIQGVGIAQFDGRIIFMNFTLMEMLGMSSLEDAVGMNLEEVYPPGEWDDIKKQMFDSVEAEGKWKAPVRMKRSDGDTILTEQNVFKIGIKGRRYLGNLVNDISHLKKIETDLRNEKEFYKSFTESLGDWVWEMDLEGNHTYSNGAVKDILGYSVEETVGRNTIDFWLDRTLTEKQLERHKKSLRSGEGWTNFQAVFRHKTGCPVYVLSSAVPIFDESGSLKGYRGIDRDVTQRVEATNKLNESRNKLNSIIETAKEIIFTSDREGILDFISPALTPTLGYEPEELLGNTIFEYVHPDDRKPLLESGRALVASGRGFDHVDYRLRKKGGGYLWQRMTMSPQLDANGNVVKIVGVTQDITDRKNNETRILQYNDLLRIINRILRHDLTNNLFMIKTALDHYRIVKEDKWLESAEAKADRSFELIDQMRSLESIVASGGSMRPVDLREAMERIRTGFEIPIEIDCDVKVMADDALYSVIENIIRNAIKHGGTDRIEVVCFDEGDNDVRLDMIDHGSGIPDEIIDRIFDETFKYGNTAGTGIGLYIAKRTVERYGGRIKVSKTPGGGATFSIWLARV